MDGQSSVLSHDADYCDQCGSEYHRRQNAYRYPVGLHNEGRQQFTASLGKCEAAYCEPTDVHSARDADANAQERNHGMFDQDESSKG